MMPWYKIPGGGTAHINFARAGNRNAPMPCCGCGWISTLLCDWKAGGVTCDKPICEKCAFQSGPDKHLCPAHIEAYRAWLASYGIPLQ